MAGSDTGILLMATSICLFIGYSLLCAWIVFGDAVDTTPGMLAAMLLGADPRASERSVKMFVGGTWCVVTFFCWLCYSAAFDF